MMKRVALILLLTGLYNLRTQAQVPIAARWNSDNPSALVGERVNLVLIAETPVEASIIFPEFPTDWPPFEVQSVGEVSKTVNGDTATYRQVVTVIAWGTGDHRTPETYIQYQLSPTDALQSILADSTVISVPSVLESGDTELRPLKPPATLPYLPPWLLLVAVGVMVVAVRGLRWWRSRQVALAGISALDLARNEGYSPKERALAELRNIRERKISSRVVYSVVADCLRTYIYHQLGINAPDMTTGELMDTLQGQALLPSSQQRDLARMLDYADLVKFADAQPGERAAKQLLDSAEKWIEAVEYAGDEITA